MNRQVFRYRSAVMYFVAGFLFIWSTGWLFGWGSTLLSGTGTIKINHQDRPVSEVLPLVFAMVAIGIAIGCGAFALILFIVNARLEVGDGWIVSYDLLGRVRVKGSLSGCKCSTAGGSSAGGNYSLITTDSGDIKVYKSIQDYGKLLSLLESRQPQKGEAPAPPVSFQPQREVFDYRWTARHLNALFAYAVGLFVPLFMLPSIKPSSGDVLPMLLPGLAFMLIAWSLATYQMLQGLNEKIQLTDGHIVWIDWRGKTRIRAPYGAILDTDYFSGNSSSTFRIVTENGTITAFSGIRGFGELRDSLAQIMAVNKGAG